MSETVGQVQDNTHKLMVGTAQFGLDYGIANINGKVSCDEVTKIIDFLALKNNISFDTASDYGNSEEVLGQHSNIISDAQIITKVSHKVQNTNGLNNSVNQSIERLKREKIDGMLLHRFEQYNTDIWQALKALKKSGKISKIGVSIYDPQEAELLIHDTEVDIIQFPFNILDWRWHDILKYKSTTKEFHVRSVYLQGALLSSDIFYKKGFGHIFEQLNFFKNEFHHKTLQSLVLSYVASFDAIDKIIIGMDSFSQFMENYAILTECSISSDDRNKIIQNFLTTPIKLLDIRKW